MTIAAAFKYQNGILLTTDTQHTYPGMMKLSRPKLIQLDFPEHDAKIAIAIAGDVSFATMAAEDIERALPAKGFSQESVQNCIREVVLDTFQKHILPFNKTEYSFDLLCAVWTKAEGLQLFQTNQTSITVAKDYGLIGLGLYLAQFLSEPYYSAMKTRDEAFMFAVDTLRKVKAHVDGCGGNTDVLWLEDDGTWKKVWSLEVESTEQFSKDFGDMAEALVRVASDMSLEESEIDEYIEVLRGELHGIRILQRARLAKYANVLKTTQASMLRASEVLRKQKQ
jgi:20S proteasome alpha/beta subunit